MSVDSDSTHTEKENVKLQPIKLEQNSATQNTPIARRIKCATCLQQKVIERLKSMKRLHALRRMVTENEQTMIYQ